MSGRAILRRQCKRAMRQLIGRFGYSENSFEIPTSKDNAHDVLPGTPIYWTPPSYYERESDCRPALEEYRYMRTMYEIDWAAMARRDEICRKGKA